MTDPLGREQAGREAAYAEAVKNMGPIKAFQAGPDGKMHEVSLDDL
ncbi:hypothetical protein [Actinomadura formosensis]